MIPKKLDLSFPCAITNPNTFYVVVPCRCVITDIQLACSIDPGDSETVTVTSGSTAIGVVAFGSDVTAGDIGTYTANASTGDTVLAEGATLKFVTTGLTAATHLAGYAVVDQFARTTL